MPIYLDSADLKHIERHLASGVVRGVTTNPTIINRDTTISDWSGLESHSRSMAALVAPRPIALEVLSEEPGEMLRQSRALAALGNNVIVKIPVHSADGATSFLPVVRTLHSEGIRVNVTAMLTAQQCLLSALAGATYVSLLAGRVGDQGGDPVAELRRLRDVLDDLDLSAKIIAASTRHPGNVLDWLAAGAHVVTVRPAVLDQMLIHPGTKDIVSSFMRDAAHIGLAGPACGAQPLAAVTAGVR
jgi:transaldolase